MHRTDLPGSSPQFQHHKNGANGGGCLASARVTSSTCIGSFELSRRSTTRRSILNKLSSRARLSSAFCQAQCVYRPNLEDLKAYLGIWRIEIQCSVLREYRRYESSALLPVGSTVSALLFSFNELPGTAITSRSCSSAQLMVSMAPLLNAASATRTPWRSPLITRLRRESFSELSWVVGVTQVEWSDAKGFNFPRISSGSFPSRNR